MAGTETLLQTADRLFAEQERRVARQLEIIGELATAGFSTEVAKDTLAMMQQMLVVLRHDRDWLEAN